MNSNDKLAKLKKSRKRLNSFEFIAVFKIFTYQQFKNTLERIKVPKLWPKILELQVDTIIKKNIRK